MAGLVSVPSVDIEYIPITAGETFKLGPLTCRILEDGSHTGTLTNPPKKTPYTQSHPIPLTLFIQTTASASPN